MNLLKKPIVWIVVAFLVFLGYVVAGYSQPAEVRFSNETRGDIKNLRLTFGSGNISIPSLLAGESVQSAMKVPSGQLNLDLETANGHAYAKRFPHTAAPRQTVVFHIVDADGVTKLFEARSNWVSGQEDFNFNLAHE
jgi:hypothetical protein